MEYLNISKNLFQPSIRIFKGFTTGSSRMIVIMFVWNPLGNTGFLFLIISKMTLRFSWYTLNVKGKKTDKKDSKWIANLFKFDLVICSFIPPKDFHQLRELARCRFKLVCIKSSKKNRIQNCMTISNVGIASVLSDSFGRTTTEILSSGTYRWFHG